MDLGFLSPEGARTPLSSLGMGLGALCSLNDTQQASLLSQIVDTTLLGLGTRWETEANK